jgi:hypothetical protein
MTIETQADVERIMLDRGVSFVFQPVLTEQPGGGWIAHYPAADWHTPIAPSLPAPPKR